MERPNQNPCEYVLSIPYTSEEELDQIIYREIFAEAESLADLRRCFIEGDRASWDDLERSW